MKMLEKLRQIFKIRGDGINFYWQDFNKRIVVGHDGRPRIGDVFTSKMKSGKIAVFEITNVRWCGDPRDMYFADVKDVGYWEEPTPAPQTSDAEEK